MEQVFLISPLVGSVIGYFTNWLAIKMLFRPLTEKRIFGLKVPLTPGVIPRRRSKLAESIGSTVGSRLLTPDAFRQILQGAEMQTKVKKFIRARLKRLESEERSLQEIINEILTEQEDRKELKQESRELIDQLVGSFLVKENLTAVTDDLLTQLDQTSLEKYFASPDYQQLKDRLLAKLDAATLEQIINSGLKLARDKAKDSNRQVKELLPQSVINKLKDWVEKQEPKLLAQLKELLQSQEMKDKLSQKVESALGSGPLLSMLGGFKDSMLDKFIKMLIDFLEEEENQEEIKAQLNKFVDSLLATPVKELAAEVTDDNLEELAQTAVDYLDESRLELLMTTIEEKIAAAIEDEDWQQTIQELVGELTTNSDFLAANAGEVIYSWGANLGQQPVCDYFADVSEARLGRMETGLVNIIEYIMEHQFGDVLANLDFEQMVVEKVNSFDVVEVEGLLLDVIETELNAITWFGAGLGFIMGLITPVISLLTG